MLQLTFRDNYVFIRKEAYSDRGNLPMPAVGMHAHLAENNVYETDKHTPMTYRVTAEDGSSQAYTVTVTVAPNPATAITAFSFASPAVSGVIDEATHTIAVTVPLGTNVGKLIPTVTHTGFSVSPNSGVEQNFTVDEKYFEVSYGISGKLPKYGVLVRNERFISAGDGNGIRPAEDTLHDNTLPYSHGVSADGTELNPGGERVFFAKNIPSSGVFQQGDLIFKSNASKGNPIGWVCTKGGTARAPVDPAEFAPMPNL